MKKIIVLIVTAIMMVSIFSNVSAKSNQYDYGYAGRVEVKCRNGAEYPVTVYKFSADLNAWNSFVVPYGCYVWGSTVSDGYSLNVYNEIIPGTSSTQTIAKVVKN